MTISIFGHRHPLMWVDQSESWFPAKHAHVRRHQTQHILCQQRLSYLRSTSNYFLVVAWFFYFFIEKADFFSKIQTFWRKRRPYLCVFFKKVLFADQSPLKRTQLVSLLVVPILVMVLGGVIEKSNTTSQKKWKSYTVSSHVVSQK